MIRQGRIADSPEGRVQYAVIPVTAMHNLGPRICKISPSVRFDGLANEAVSFELIRSSLVYEKY
jgi:hypothetical protein